MVKYGIGGFEQRGIEAVRPQQPHDARAHRRVIIHDKDRVGRRQGGSLQITSIRN
jgi:hypothetical protein